MIRETWVRVPLRAKTPIFSGKCIGKREIYYFRVSQAILYDNYESIGRDLKVTCGSIFSFSYD